MGFTESITDPRKFFERMKYLLDKGRNPRCVLEEIDKFILRDKNLFLSTINNDIEKSWILMSSNIYEIISRSVLSQTSDDDRCSNMSFSMIIRHSGDGGYKRLHLHLEKIMSMEVIVLGRQDYPYRLEMICLIKDINGDIEMRSSLRNTNILEELISN